MSLPAPPLWEHQREAVKDLTAELTSAGRATNVMACGTGKTRVGAEVAGLVASSEPVLIVVPTLDLVAQTLTAWLEALGREALGRVIAVCGDKEVMDRDDAADLVTLQVEVTSDAGRLAELLRERWGRSTVAITYQSLPKLVAAHRFRGVQPWKLVVVDEAHRSAGVKNRKWAVIHDDVQVPASKRLYMTATPRLVSARDGDLTEVVSMDDEKVFGRVAHRLSFAQARERRLLADYRVIVSVVTDEEMHRLATERERNTFLQVGPSAVSAPMLARQVAVLRAARELKIQRMLTYHRRVMDARWFSQTLQRADALLGRADTLTTGYVYGSQRRALRRSELAKLADSRLDRVVISNARVLSEGYDAPAVDGVAFIDARKSTIDTVQALGRALRLGGKKDKTAYILVPVLMEPGQDPIGALQGSAYAPVWQVVRALAAHDEALGAELEARRRELGRTPCGQTLDELPEWLHITGMPVPHRFAEAITVQAVRSTTVSWEEHMGAAAAYVAEHGDLLVRADFVTESGLPLGQWIRSVRQLHKDGKLSPARHAQLDELGMIWDVLDENFTRHLEAAAKYRAKYGNLRIPRGYITPGPDQIRLGEWISRLRVRREQLSTRQREALDELGMVWNVFAEDWNRGIEAARSYRQRNGHLRVPYGHVEEPSPGSKGFPLGAWLSARRRERHTTLTPERIAELDALGMIWDQHENAWRRNFEALKAYYARHGNLDMSPQHIERLPDGEIALGTWLYRQRAGLKSGTLSAERTAALESLGVKLIRAQDRAWLHALTFARLYHKKFGNLNIPASQTIRNSDGEEFKLGSWISKTRERRIRGKLTVEQISELDALGMVWDSNEASWLANYTAAKVFYKIHGHLTVPRKYVTPRPEELRLGFWIARQRADFRKGKLSVQRVKALTKIGMRWS